MSALYNNLVEIKERQSKQVTKKQKTDQNQNILKNGGLKERNKTSNYKLQSLNNIPDNLKVQTLIKPLGGKGNKNAK